MAAQEIITDTSMGHRQRLFWTKLRRNPSALGGMFLVFLTLIAAVFGHWLAPHNPSGMHLTQHLLPPLLAGGTGAHILGTDYLGRDELSRIIVGTGPSITISLIAVLISMVIGTTLGLYGGYYGGWLGSVVTFLIDAQMAFPFILLALTLMAISGPGPGKLILALALSGWTNFARVIRGQAMQYREKMFVESAKAIGASNQRIIFRHILVNIATSVIVIGTMNIAINILLEAGLTFIGLGLNPSIPSWGSMLANGRDYIQTAWWLTVFPGVAIMLSVIGFNLLGDWLRDVWDPRSR